MNWRPAGPELIVAAVAVVVAAAAGAAVAGWPGVVAVAVATAVLALLLLRAVLPRSAGPSFRRSREKPQPRALSGYSQRRWVVNMSLTSRGTYEADLRPALEHILAARLAERHAVNLYTEPDKARQAFCRTRSDAALWPWIDPAQAQAQVRNAKDQARDRRGIPSRTLRSLITRLEQL